MKYSKKHVGLLALSLAAAAPCHAFTAPATPMATGLRSNVALKRPLAVPILFMAQNENGDLEQQGLPPQKKSSDPTPVLFSFFKDQIPRNTLVAAGALAMALTFSPLASDAAMSGGRMGGASFQSRPSMSRPMPSRSSYSGGGGYYGGSGYYSRGPMLAPVPMITPFTPFYSPFGYGAAVMPFRGPSLFPLFLFGGMALLVSNAVRGFSGPSASFFEERETPSVLGSGTSVVKMSVALDVSDRDDPNSILSVLNRLAQTSRMDNRMGVQNLSSQVAVELLRRKSSIVSASTDYQYFKNRDQAQRQFNSMSIQERGKFERETVSKFDGVDYNNGPSYSQSPSSRSNGVSGKATMAVITLVLAIDGDSTKVPKIRSLRDVEDALQKIASDVKVSDCLQGAEILWTPEDRTESLSPRDVVADYPELNTV